MSLALATRQGNLELFLSIAQSISSVCCCRCAPSQKREITKAVKLSGKRVLGIGDGGNDVGMIEEAHIGVGISGREGKQAALSSDYSIGEFKAVVKLLLWHGRLIYRTTAKTCMFIMHRGMIIATMQFCFSVMFFLIDVPLFNGILMFGYSTVFTNLPVISIVRITLVWSHPLDHGCRPSFRGDLGLPGPVQLSAQRQTAQRQKLCDHGDKIHDPGNPDHVPDQPPLP